ncbi:MAG: zinc-dependent metalloprotease [Candidatus Cyclobacteriaceae bacterium M3_2C_046]
MRLIIHWCMLAVILIMNGLKAQAQDQNQRLPLEEKIRDLKHYPGFFDFYYDAETDKIWLLIEKLDQEVLYINSLTAGIGSNDIGLDRNQLGDSRIIKFVRRGPKILAIQPNYKYRAITNNLAEQKAVEQAFAQSVLFGFKVAAEKDGKILVDATDFLLQDAHQVAEKLKQTGQGNYQLAPAMSTIYLEGTMNFPRNSEFETLLTFTGKPEGAYISSVAPTPTHISVRMHHSLVALPDDQFQPRPFDSRAGYFGISYKNYSAPINQEIDQRFIVRHRLQKKDPVAKKSEPIAPIVYYLDPGTPEPVRSALLEGAGWWNQAFEAAGYTNAFQVKILPEGAHPMDVRYNMINWVHRSTRGWSYGSSVVDPRTGEIIKGHVLLGSLRVRQDFLIARGLLSPYKNESSGDQALQEMALARLRQLSAHEVGHTLGLAHSYASSSENQASVMDYPHPMVRLKDGQIDLSQAYDTGIGEWDQWAIRYGYEDFPPGTDEHVALQSIIRESLAGGLSFLSDQDARPSGSAHPYAHLWDNGSNAAEELDRVMKIRETALQNMGTNTIKQGEPWSKLEEVLVPVYFFHRYQTEAAVKLIGGLNYRYAHKGDDQVITEYIDPDLQEAALESVLATLDGEALVLPEKVLRLIPPRPMGYARDRELVKIRTAVTFDPLAAAESSAGHTLSLLLHPARAQRLLEYHSRNPQQPSLSWVLDRIMAFTWKKALAQQYQGQVEQVVAQVALNQLINLTGSDQSSESVKAISLQQLLELKAFCKQKRAETGLSTEQKAHFGRAVHLIEQFEDDPDEFKGLQPLEPPPGSPIGQDCINWSLE